MRTGVTIVLIMVLLVSGVAYASSETEPNNSMDSPQIIGEGVVSGSVNMSDEMDIFRVDVPESNIMFYSLKKTDTAKGSISMELYDSSREPVYSHHTPYGESRGLTVAGEMTANYMVNKDEATNYFIIVTGTGEYEVNVSMEGLDDPDDAHDELGPPTELENGDSASGRVYVIERMGKEYNDQDRYVMILEEDTTVKVTMTRTDAGNSKLSAGIGAGYGYSDEVELTDQGESKTLEHEVYLGYSETEEEVFLYIWGEGEYEIEVEYDNNMPSETLLFGVMGGVLCISMAMSLLPLVIVIVIIIIVIKASKKKKGKSKTVRPSNK